MKNNLVRDYNQAFVIFSRENSKQKNSTSTYDAQNLYKKMQALQRDMIALKSEIARASAPIMSHVISIAEFKGYISSITHISTKNGIFRESAGYGSDPYEVTYEAFLKPEDVDKEVAKYQKFIEAAQDEIDNFNATTTITIDFSFVGTDGEIISQV